MDAIYVSNNSFKVMGDETANFSDGRRVKTDSGLDGIKYASVVSSSYSSPWTTVVIDESDLTASLTSAWYGVISTGETGSIPNHSHSSAEGVGGLLEVAFTDLTDTPATYSGAENLYLQVNSTANGVEFSFVPTSGTDDHTHSAYVPWDFGSGTISGTGDIYCNDIYTSSGTVYIGGTQLTTNAGILYVDAVAVASVTYVDTVSGSLQSEIDNKTASLLDLTDTPTTYDEGKYLRSTTSGTEWATVSGVVLEAPNGSEWRLQVTNSGILYTTEVV